MRIDHPEKFCKSCLVPIWFSDVWSNIQTKSFLLNVQFRALCAISSRPSICSASDTAIDPNSRLTRKRSCGWSFLVIKSVLLLDKYNSTTRLAI